MSQSTFWLSNLKSRLGILKNSKLLKRSFTLGQSLGVVLTLLLTILFFRMFSGLTYTRETTGKQLDFAPAESYSRVPRGMVSSIARDPIPASAAVGRRAGGPNVAEDLMDEMAKGGAVAKSALASRKIIYTANVDLVTEVLDTIEPRLSEMIRIAGGFISETNQSGNTGGQRTAMWKVRIPVENYDGFLQSVRTLGEVERVQVNSQDVTEEYVDVTARIGSKKVQEERLIDLLKNAVGKLDEVLKVESELARVRSEIERMEGRLRFLKDQTDLTTVTLNVREVKDYQPPEAPGFATKIRRTWDQSTQRLTESASQLILNFVAFVPFIPIYLTAFVVFFWSGRWVFRKIGPWLTLRIEMKASPDSESNSSEPKSKDQTD
ncbi:MAG: hypothetical protein RJA81_1489 [Planctomycetota bacterium]